MQRLRLSNGSCVVQSPLQMIIQTDAAFSGWGAVCLGDTTEGTWSYQQQKWLIKFLELLVLKLTPLNYTKDKAVKSIHFQKDNTRALRYLLKMRETIHIKLIELSKEIWLYLHLKGIAITAE